MRTPHALLMNGDDGRSAARGVCVRACVRTMRSRTAESVAVMLPPGPLPAPARGGGCCSAGAVPWTRGGQLGRRAAAGGVSADARADGPLQGGRASGLAGLLAGGHRRAGDVHLLADGRALSRVGRTRRQESSTQTCASSDAQAYSRESYIAVVIRPTSGASRKRRRRQRRSGPLDEGWSVGAAGGSRRGKRGRAGRRTAAGRARKRAGGRASPNRRRPSPC